jgi:hypothetical protein
MDKPKRIQLSRKRGWRKPDGVVSVGRGTRWGNPFKLDGTIDARYVNEDVRDRLKARPVCGEMSAREAVAAFRLNLLRGELSFSLDDVRRELRGRDLACWCKPGEPCHADELIWYANEQPDSV